MFVHSVSEQKPVRTGTLFFSDAVAACNLFLRVIFQLLIIFVIQQELIELS